MDMLKRYDEIEKEIEALRTEQNEIHDALKRHVYQYGEVADYGWRATIKPGRKSTDHEAAAMAANVPTELIKKYTITKPSISWAKITKEFGCDVTPFTTKGDPSFVVERMK